MNDHDIDSVLNNAFGSRHGSASARPSLTDVRRRARRRHRRTMSAGVGALAITGVGGLVAIAQRSPGTATSPSAGAVGDATTTMPCFAVTTSIEGTVPEWTTTLAPLDTGPTGDTAFISLSDATTTSYDTYDPGCTPPEPLADGYRCLGEGATDQDGWTYYSYCEPAGVVAATTIVPGDDATVSTVAYFTDSVLIVDGSGDPAAVGEVIARLAGANVEVVAATRSVEQTMLMPTGSNLDVAYTISGWLGIGGFDTLDSSVIPQGALRDDVAVVVVIGRDRATTERADVYTTTTSIEAVAP